MKGGKKWEGDPRRFPVLLFEGAVLVLRDTMWSARKERNLRGGEGGGEGGGEEGRTNPWPIVGYSSFLHYR